MRYVISVIVAILAIMPALAGVPNQSAGSKRTFRFYDPDVSRVSLFQNSNLMVFSETSKGGEQVDIVRKGNFDKECYLGKENRFHVRSCTNLIVMVAVEEEINLFAGRDGQDGLNGRDGEQGERGERGPQGRPGKTVYIPASAPTVNNYNYSFAPSYYPSAQMMGAIGATYIQTQIAGVSTSTPMNISVSSSATGGSTGPIVVENNNSNSNVNSNANNNTINVGSGTANGVARADGASAANSGTKK